MSTAVRRWRDFAAGFGMALVLVALVLWTGASGDRVWLAWAATGLLIALGGWLEMRSEALRSYGRIVLVGALGTLYAVTFSAHRHGSFVLLRNWFLAIVALGLIAEGITFCAGRRNSTSFAAFGFALAGFGVAIQPFGSFYLASAILLAASAGWFLVRYGGSVVAWLTLIVLYAGFLAWWPFDDGRLDADRYLELHEFWATLLAFGLVWLLFAWNSALARAFERRAAFLTLNNALFYGLGVLIIPPRHPDWHWKFTLVFGIVLLIASALSRRSPEVRRAYVVQGGLLAVFGVVSALTGREPAPMLAIASAFCVLTAARCEHWLLRDLAYAAALLAVVCVWMPIRDHAENGLRLGALIGAVLVFIACWIDSRRDLWERWAVATFTALGLGVWLLTTLHFTPEIHRAPVLAVLAALLTLSFATLGVREIPWLAKAFSIVALVVWFMQLDAFVRPWCHPVVLVLSTIGVSYWWQTRGRGLLPGWELRLVQAVAAAASMMISLLWIDGRLGHTPAAIVAMSLLAVVILIFALTLRDRFLAAFSQLFTIAAAGEFIGQHSTAPLPGALAALAPIVALPAMAPLIRKHFADSEWERPARGVALLYGVLGAAMFVAWTMHYVGPANRFPTLALAAMALLLWTVAAQPRGPLLASLVCSTGALLAYWLGWIGVHGFRWRDLFAFVLLLGFGVVGRRTRVLPPMIQEMGIVIGLGSVVNWVSLWAPIHFPAMPLAAVWSVIAVVVLVLGWWLDEPLYRGIAWVLLVAAFIHVIWVEAREAAPFRFGLFAVGTAMLIAAFSYSRRSATAAPS